MTLWFISFGGPLHHSVGKPRMSSLLASLHLGPRHHDLIHPVVRRLPNSLELLAVCQAAIRVGCDLVPVVGSRNRGIYTRLHCPHHPPKRDVEYRESKLELPLTSSVRARKGDRRCGLAWTPLSRPLRELGELHLVFRWAFRTSPSACGQPDSGDCSPEAVICCRSVVLRGRMFLGQNHR